jgi:hypothetical protein
MSCARSGSARSRTLMQRFANRTGTRTGTISGTERCRISVEAQVTDSDLAGPASRAIVEPSDLNEV